MRDNHRIVNDIGAGHTRFEVHGAKVKPAPMLSRHLQCSCAGFRHCGVKGWISSLVLAKIRPGTGAFSRLGVGIRERQIRSHEHLPAGTHRHTMDSATRQSHVIHARRIARVHPQPRHPNRQQHQPPRRHRRRAAANPSPDAFAALAHSCFGIRVSDVVIPLAAHPAFRTPLRRRPQIIPAVQTQPPLSPPATPCLLPSPPRRRHNRGHRNEHPIWNDHPPRTANHRARATIVPCHHTHRPRAARIGGHPVNKGPPPTEAPFVPGQAPQRNPRRRILESQIQVDSLATNQQLSRDAIHLDGLQRPAVSRMPRHSRLKHRPGKHPCPNRQPNQATPRRQRGPFRRRSRVAANPPPDALPARCHLGVTFRSPPRVSVVYRRRSYPQSNGRPTRKPPIWSAAARRRFSMCARPAQVVRIGAER